MTKKEYKNFIKEKEKEAEALVLLASKRAEAAHKDLMKFVHQALQDRVISSEELEQAKKHFAAAEIKLQKAQYHKDHLMDWDWWWDNKAMNEMIKQTK